MDGYLELLRRRFGTKRVNCNIVYQEYIAYREHIHMNSTQWETLTEFIKWLGREGTEMISFKYFYFENSFYFYKEIKLLNIQSIHHFFFKTYEYGILLYENLLTIGHLSTCKLTMRKVMQSLVSGQVEIYWNVLYYFIYI